MKTKKKLNFGKNSLEVEGRLIIGAEKYLGLMFTPKKDAEILVFDFESPTKIAIHSFFVFFDFLAIWLDENDKVVSIKKIKPFNPYVSPSMKFKTLIEIPISPRYSKILDDIERFK